MGLLDNFSLDNLDDPKNAGLLAMGLSMLAPKPYKTSLLGDIGMSGMQGLQTLAKAKIDERANRQNDLQQLAGAYSLLKQQEFAKMLAAKQNGQPYSPNPMLPQMEARLGQLTGLGNLSGKSAMAAPPPALPQGPPAPPAMPPVGMAPPSQSPMANPDYQPPMVRPPMPAQMPQAPQPQGMPQGSPDGLGGPAGGLPMEAWLAMDPTGAKYMEQIAKDNAPQSTRYGIFMKDPSNPRRYVPAGGALPQGAMPYSFDPQGNPSIAPLPGQVETAAKMAAASSAGKAAGEFPFKTENVQLASGAMVPKLTQSVVGSPNVGGLPFLSQLFGGQPQSQAPQIPQSVIDADRSGKPFNATQAPGGPVVFGQPKSDSQDPLDLLPKVPVVSGIGQTTSQKVLDQLRGEKTKALSDQYGAESDVASQRIAQNTQALDLVDQADTGWLANHWGEFRSVLGTLGVKSAADKAATDQELGKDLIGTALTKGKQLFGSRFTQSEVGIMLSKASPSPEMQKAAIKFLLQTDNATQNYNIKRGTDFNQALNKGADPLAFAPAYATQFPMTDALKGIVQERAGTSAPTQVRRYNPSTGRIE